MGVPAGPTTFDPDTDGLPDVLAASRLPRGGAGRVVALLSTDLPGEDAWACRSAASVARGWAQTGVRVFLADLSLSEPRLHETLGLDNEEGVTDMFRFGTSVQRVARRIDDLPFFFASAGSPTWDPGEILSNDRWGQLAEGFKEAGAALLLYVPASAPGASSILRRASEALILGDETPGVLAEAEGLPVVAWVSRSGAPPSTGAVEGGDEAAEPVDEAPSDAPSEAPAASGAEADGWAPVDDWSESETQEWEIDGEVGAEEPVPPDRDPWGLGAVDLTEDEPDEADASPWEGPAGEPATGAVGDPLEGEPGGERGEEHTLDGIAPELEISSDAAPSMVGGGSALDDESGADEVAWSAGDAGWDDPAPDGLVADGPDQDAELAEPPPLADEAPSDPLARSAASDESAADVAPPHASDVDLPRPVPLGAGEEPAATPSQTMDPPAQEPSPSRRPRAASDRRARRRSRGVVVWGGLAAALALAGYGLWDSGIIGGGAGGAGGEPPAGEEAAAAPEADEGATDATEPGATTPVDETPNGAEPVADPGEPTSPVLGASLVLRSFPERDQAQALADQLSQGLGDLLFIVVPSTVDQATWYRTMAGPARDLTEIPGIRERIENADLPALAGSAGWFPRVTELAFLLDEVATIEDADGAAASYRTQGIPAYVLAVDYSAGLRRYRVYAGGYAFQNESAPLAGIIREAGLTPNLVQRIGSMPRSRAPR